MKRQMVLAVAAMVLALFCRTSLPASTQNQGGTTKAAGTARVEDVDAIVGTAELLVFGEASHWDFGVHGFVNRLFRHLAEKRGFRVFVLESAWGVDDATRAFIASERTTVLPNESFFLNAFGSPETVETLVWIREWNKAHPDDPVRVAGYQPEQPVHDFQALWTYLTLNPAFEAADLRVATAACKASAGEFKTDIELIGPMTKLRRAGQVAFPPSDRTACLQGINTVETFLNTQKAALVTMSSALQFREMQLHITSLRGFYELIVRIADASVDKTLTPEQTAALGKEGYDTIDRIRTEIFEGLRETRYSGKKMLLWMHNWHAARHSEEIEVAKPVNIPKGTRSMGSRLKTLYGPRLVTIGSVVTCARCKAATPDGLAERFRDVLGDGTAIVNIGAVPASLRALPLSVPGALIEPLNDTVLRDVVLSRQFDGLYYQSPSDTMLDRRKK